MVALGTVQDSGAGSGIVGNGSKPCVGGQLGGGAECGEVTRGDGKKLGSQARADTGDALDDVGLVVTAEAFDDLFVESFDLVV